MTNPASARRAPAPQPTDPSRPRARRRRIARFLAPGGCLVACLLLAGAASVGGGAATGVLAAWVAVLAVVGLRLATARRAERPLPRPELILAAFDEDGQIGEPHALPVMATPSAAYTLHARPRG